MGDLRISGRGIVRDELVSQYKVNQRSAGKQRGPARVEELGMNREYVLSLLLFYHRFW